MADGPRKSSGLTRYQEALCRWIDAREYSHRGPGGQWQDAKDAYFRDFKESRKRSFSEREQRWMNDPENFVELLRELENGIPLYEYCQARNLRCGVVYKYIKEDPELLRIYTDTVEAYQQFQLKRMVDAALATPAEANALAKTRLVMDAVERQVKLTRQHNESYLQASQQSQPSLPAPKVLQPVHIKANQPSYSENSDSDE